MAKDSAYKVDYKDSQLKAIDKEGNAAVKDSNSMFDSMIKQSDGYFQSQIDAVKDYGETQQKNQQAQTDQTIKEINQQKDQLHQDYLKEQTGAYVDWQKQSDQYGSNAEQMAASGLAHTGYSESSQVAMYNQYQNRVATARESYVRAKQNYDNAITEARLQNNSLLAEIAFNTLQTSLELSLQGFQYKNTLVQDKAAAAREIDNTYYSRYQDRISQINHENSMAEQIRQYNQDYKLKVKQYNESIRQFNVEIARLKAQDKKENEYKIKQLELQKAQLEEEKRQFNKSYELQKKKSDVSSSGGSSSSSGSAKNKKSSSSSSKKSSSGSSSSKKTTSSKAKSSSNPQIDMNSVIALGYGPISASKLDSLVASGKVIQYVENGKVKFKNKPSINSKDSFKTFLPNTAKKFGLK